MKNDYQLKPILYHILNETGKPSITSANITEENLVADVYSDIKTYTLTIQFNMNKEILQSTNKFRIGGEYYTEEEIKNASIKTYPERHI